VVASRRGIANIGCALVVIVATNGGVDASGIISRYAIFGGTIVVIVAVDRSVVASGIRIAGIDCTDIGIVAVYECFSATSISITSINVAFVCLSTSYIRMLTT